MKNQFLALFDSQKTQELFSKNLPSLSTERKNVCRLLAAYFLNYPIVSISHNAPVLPSLFSWEQMTKNELLELGFLDLQRSELASKLTADHSPRAVVLLLCKCGLQLEAVLYCDHFNDFRSTLICRFYTDYSLGLSTFISALPTVIENLIEYIDLSANLENSLQLVQASIHTHIECIVQLSCVFVPELLETTEYAIIQQLDVCFSTLSDKVSSNILLPRPPVFSTPAQYDVHDESELITWNKMYFLISAFINLLQQTNRLPEIIARTFNQINSAANSSDAGLSTIFENDEIFDSSYSNFVNVILIIMRMYYRDMLTILSDDNDGLDDILRESYLSLFLNDAHVNNNELFENFIANAQEPDLSFVTMFLHHVKDNYAQHQSFLPPLVSDSLVQWKNFLTKNVCMLTNTTIAENFPSWMCPEKISLHSTAAEKLFFLETKFQNLSLVDSTLLQITLKLNTKDFYSDLTMTIKSQLNSTAETTDVNDVFKKVAETTTMSNVLHLSAKSTGIDLDKFESELQREKVFIKSLSEVKPFNMPVAVHIPLINQREPTLHEVSPFKFDIMNQNLTKELELLGKRLAIIRTTTPINFSHTSIQKPILSPTTSMSSYSSTTTTTGSRRQKSQSEARLKRSRMKELQSSSPSTASGSNESALPVSSSFRRKDYLPTTQLIPVPSPPSLEKLNFSLLSPTSPPKEKQTWKQIEVYTQSPKLKKSHDTINGAYIPSLELTTSSLSYESVADAKTEATKITIHNENPIMALQKQQELPSWLKLLPRNDDDSGRPNTAKFSRLLDMETALKLSARSVRHVNDVNNMYRHDSGFLEEVSTPKKSVHRSSPPQTFSCSMTDEQINELMHFCN